MAAEVRMPKLGVSMVEATLTEWTISDGSAVAAGEVIATIETDKVDQEVEAPESGILRHIAEPGVTYEVGQLLAEIVS